MKAISPVTAITPKRMAFKRDTSRRLFKKLDLDRDVNFLLLEEVSTLVIEFGRILGI